MKKIVLPCLPDPKPKSTWKAIWVNEDTQEKIRALSEASGISMYRLTDYIVNMGLEFVELEVSKEVVSE